VPDLNETFLVVDRTVKFRLKRPFPHLPLALVGPGGTVPAIMPERLGGHLAAPAGKGGGRQRPLPLPEQRACHDVRVKPSESEQIVAAMQQHGIPVTYVCYSDEGHGLGRSENRRSFTAVGSCAAIKAPPTCG
jgi:Prolyl oligopeptidase family